MDKISICSVNCQGLGNPSKRRDVFSYLRNKKYSILCLQDTHFTKNIEHIIKSEWGYKAYFSSFSSQSRGVAILFNNNFDFTVHNFYNDQRGNIIILDIEIDNRRIRLVTLYGPNSDEPNFYDNVKKLILQQGNTDIILVGDWNILLNPTLDGKNYKHVNNPNARQRLLKLITELNLYDVWRDENGEKCMYTWRRKINSGYVQMGRLDFFLVSETLISYTSEVAINLSYRSDHSVISMSLSFKDIPKPKNYWKFNNSLLKNKDYINEIKNVIIQIKNQYSVTNSNLENIDVEGDENIQFSINPQLFFEVLLLEIRSKSISFATAVKKKENLEMKLLTSEIKVLESTDPEMNFDAIKLKQDELKMLREKKLQGTLIRSRARWVEYGEKATNYFCNLEKRNFISKHVSSVYNDKEEELIDSEQIKNEFYKFYQNLYSSKEMDIENVDLENVLKPETPKLTEVEADSLEGHITLKEAGETLYKMNNNKSPGSSGFTVEFLKIFLD